VARAAGAIVPFTRSPEASNDYATLSEVTTEVLREFKTRGRVFDAFCVLLPTAPFIRPQTLEMGLAALYANEANDSVMPIVAFEYPVQRALKTVWVEGRSYMKMVWPEYIEARSQDCEGRYHDVGQFYWMKVDYFTQNQPKWLIGDHTAPLEVPASEVQDIDTDDDWRLAELKYDLSQSRAPAAAPAATAASTASASCGLKL